MAIPQYQLGRHLTSVIVTPQSVGTAGALTDVTSAAVTITTVMESLQDVLSPEVEEINAVNSTRQNGVVISDGASLDIEILKVNNGSDPHPLKSLCLTYDYFKAVWIEGTGGSAKTHTMYGHRGEVSGGIRGRGKQIGRFQLGPVDNGTATYTIA